MAVQMLKFFELSVALPGQYGGFTDKAMQGNSQAVNQKCVPVSAAMEIKEANGF